MCKINVQHINMVPANLNFIKKLWKVSYVLTTVNQNKKVMSEH